MSERAAAPKLSINVCTPVEDTDCLLCHTLITCTATALCAAACAVCEEVVTEGEKAGQGATSHLALEAKFRNSTEGLPALGVGYFR